MRELKRLLLLVLFLTFLGGIGTGAWIGSLTASPAAATPVDDDRVAEFQRRLGLDATQVRKLREILGDHDRKIRRIQNEITAQQFKRKLAQEDFSREQIKGILTLKQREEYDKLLGRR